MNASRLTTTLLAACALALPATAAASGPKTYGYKVIAASGSSTWHGVANNGTGDATLSWKLAKATAGAPNNAHLITLNGRTWVGDITFNYFGTLTASDSVQSGKSCSSTVHSGQDPFDGTEPAMGQLALSNSGKKIAATWTFLPLADLVFDDPDDSCAKVDGPPWPDMSDAQRATTVPLSAFTNKKKLTLKNSGTITQDGSLTWKTSVTLQRVLPKKKKRR